MGKKKSVVRDELNIKNGGLYCVTPYERKQDGKMILKIGMTTTSFANRLNQYSTYFPLGVWMCAFLESPPVRTTRASKTKKVHYAMIEKEIIDNAVSKGALKIYSTDRVRNVNVKDEGETEWLYTTEAIIAECFQEAEAKYSGNLHIFSLKHINMNYANRMKKKNAKYIGEIIYDVTEN